MQNRMRQAEDGVVIRSARVADAPAIARVHVESWRTTYSGMLPRDFLDGLRYEDRERMWTRVLGGLVPEQPETVVVAEHAASGIVGFASGGPDRDEPERYDAELYAIYLLAEWQGQGIGRRLFDAVVQAFCTAGLRSLRLWVAAGNSAERFYERMGGVAIGEKLAIVGGIDLREVCYAWGALPPRESGH